MPVVRQGTQDQGVPRENQEWEGEGAEMNATQLLALTEKPERVAGTHIVFARSDDFWIVATKRNDWLGDIKWHDKWKCYEFLPEDGTGYDPVCLREIAAFCEAMTRVMKGKV